MAETSRNQSNQPEQPKRRTCGTMPVHERLMRTNPAYLAARVTSENYYHEFVLMRRAQLRVGVTSIPLVVHVVYNTAEQIDAAASALARFVPQSLTR